MSLCNLLRVPPIFVMDELLKSSFALPEFADIIYGVNNKIVFISQIETVLFTQYYKDIFLSFMKIIVSCLSKLN